MSDYEKSGIAGGFGGEGIGAVRDPKSPGKKRVRWIAAGLAAVIVLTGAFVIGKNYFARDILQLVLGKARYTQNLQQKAADAAMEKLVLGLDKAVSLVRAASQEQSGSGSLEVKLEPEEGFYRSVDQAGDGQAEAWKQAVSFLNSLKMNYTGVQNSDADELALDISDSSGKLLTARLNQYRGGLYLSLPDIADESLLLMKREEAPGGLQPENLGGLKYDSARLTESLKKLSEVYARAFSEAEIKTENNQKLTVGGDSVEGQKLTAGLTADRTQELIDALKEAAGKDEYLFTVYSENYLLFGGGEKEEPTREDFAKAIEDFVEELGFQERTSIAPVFYLSPDSSVLAVCLEITDKDGKGQINTLFSQNRQAVEVVSEDFQAAYSNTVLDGGSGKLQLDFRSGQEPKNIGFALDYSDVRAEQYLGAETVSGKFVFSLSDPDGFVKSQFEQAAGAEGSFDRIGESTLTLELSSPGPDSRKSSAELNVPELIKISAAASVSGKAGAGEIAPEPSGDQVLDVQQGLSEQDGTRLTMGMFGHLSSLLEKDRELGGLIGYFGLTKEQIDMTLLYYAQMQQF